MPQAKRAATDKCCRSFDNFGEPSRVTYKKDGELSIYYNLDAEHYTLYRVNNQYQW